MECVKYEWKKFITFRFFWLLCVVIFTFNVWIYLRSQDEMATIGGCKELYADLKQQPKEERERWLKELNENKAMSYTGNFYAEEELYKKILHEFCPGWTV